MCIKYKVLSAVLAFPLLHNFYLENIIVSKQRDECPFSFHTRGIVYACQM